MRNYNYLPNRRVLIRFWLMNTKKKQAYIAVIICTALSVLMFKYVQTSQTKVTNLSLPFKKEIIYSITKNKTKKNKCVVIKGKQEVLTRAKTESSKVSRDCFKFNEDDYFIHRKNKRPFFLIRFNNIDDPFFPYFYNKEKISNKIEMKWIQLFVDGIYAGLYLKHDIPMDKTKKTGRKGNRKNIFEIKGDKYFGVDTKLRENNDYVASLVAEGKTLVPTKIKKSTFVLYSLINSENVVGVVEKKDKVRLLPTMLKLEKSFNDIYGKANKVIVDNRYKLIRKQIKSFSGKIKRDLSDLESYRKFLNKMMSYDESINTNIKSYSLDKFRGYYE